IASWSGSESPGEDMDRLSDSGGDKTMDGDPEGVWSPDIEQSFQEALAIYPPCGRRKIILSDEGKMYGRNELIARYIKLRTGKTRTRKQVSSHIQVLARRKSREFQSKLKDQNAKEKALQSISSMSSAQIVSATAIHSKLLCAPSASRWWRSFDLCLLLSADPAATRREPRLNSGFSIPGYEPPAAAQTHREPAWQGRSIGTTKLRLVEFSSFLETQREQEAYNKHLFVHISQSSPTYSDPLLECVDIRQIYDKFPEKKGGLKELFGKGPQNAFYLIKFWVSPSRPLGVSLSPGVSASSLSCCVKFANDLSSLWQTEYARFENGRFVYRISRSPMCEYMINFIHKLKHLPEKYMMNSVLENFTILLVVSNRDTQETLLCMACVFEVSNNEHGAQHHIYRLIKE
uniref:TEA domain family member 1a n=1 Tax=Stegastes partitus TaxID=144197 RepID=A0A3B5AHV9_9TELE